MPLCRKNKFKKSAQPKIQAVPHISYRFADALTREYPNKLSSFGANTAFMVPIPSMTQSRMMV